MAHSVNETLLEVAAWCDEEFRLLAMRPSGGESRDQHAQDGSMATFAELGALFRWWAATGKAPQHCPTRLQWRVDYERNPK